MRRTGSYYTYTEISGNKDSAWGVQGVKHIGSFKDKSLEFKRLVPVSLQYGQIPAHTSAKEPTPLQFRIRVLSLVRNPIAVPKKNPYILSSSVLVLQKLEGVQSSLCTHVDPWFLCYRTVAQDAHHICKRCVTCRHTEFRLHSAKRLNVL